MISRQKGWRPRFFTVWIAGIAAAMTAAGCGGHSGIRAPDLTLSEARVRLAPDFSGGAVFLKIENRGLAADRLFLVETQAAKVVEIHETVHDGEMVRMVHRPEGFEIPARSTVELKSGGKHIMLIGARPPSPEARSTIPVVFHFKNSGRIGMEIPIEP